MPKTPKDVENKITEFVGYITNLKSEKEKKDSDGDSIYTNEEKKKMEQDILKYEYQINIMKWFME